MNNKETTNTKRRKIEKIMWFVSYTEQTGKGRTSETKAFNTFSEAREFAKGEVRVSHTTFRRWGDYVAASSPPLESNFTLTQQPTKGTQIMTNPPIQGYVGVLVTSDNRVHLPAFVGAVCHNWWDADINSTPEKATELARSCAAMNQLSAASYTVSYVAVGDDALPVETEGGFAIEMLRKHISF